MSAPAFVTLRKASQNFFILYLVEGSKKISLNYCHFTLVLF